MKDNVGVTKPVLSLIWIITGLILALLLPVLFLLLHVRISYFKPILFFVSCILFYYSTFKKKKYEQAIKNMMLGIVTFLTGYFIYDIAITFSRIPQWDFISFYLFGKVGLSHQNFYDPHVFMNFFTDLHLKERVDAGFVPEIVNVGFWYPPPSMFLFLPLGFFNLSTAYFIWQGVMILFFCLDVFLLAKYYKINLSSVYSNSVTVLFSIISILLFPSLTSAITYSQTVSVFLFFLILMLQNISNWKAGILLGILVVIKPLAIIFILYFILYKKWAVVRSFIFTGLLILSASLLFFGFHSFLNYFLSAPTSRIPQNLFYEDTIESLNGVFLRVELKILGYINFKNSKVYILVFSILITLITVYASKKTPNKNGIFPFIIFMPMTLLIYPNTQDFYIVLLLPFILYLLIKKRFNHNVYNVVSILFLYTIGYYSLFLLDLMLWIFLILWFLPFDFNTKGLFHSFKKINAYEENFFMLR